MRCLFVKQPYASEIAYGRKVEEFRSLNWHYRGPLLICASRNPAPCTSQGPLPVGVAVGIVDLVDVRQLGPKDFVYVLENPRQVEPIAIKGQVRPFEYQGPPPVPTDDHVAAYWRFIGESARARALAESKAKGEKITQRAKAEAAQARGNQESVRGATARAIAVKVIHGAGSSQRQVARQKRAAFNRRRPRNT